MRDRVHSIWLALSLAALLGGGQVVAQTATADDVAEPTPATSAPRAPSPSELLPNGKMPLDGVLTGGQPTVEQFEKLAALGYKTVINLRSPAESGSTDPAAVQALGMSYLSLPITGASDLGRENAARLAEALAKSEYPVVVHCASGNRVGALFAMKAFYVDGEGPEGALALGRAAGVTRLEPAVKRELGLE